MKEESRSESEGEKTVILRNKGSHCTKKYNHKNSLGSKMCETEKYLWKTSIEIFLI